VETNSNPSKQVAFRLEKISLIALVRGKIKGRKKAYAAMKGRQA